MAFVMTISFKHLLTQSFSELLSGLVVPDEVCLGLVALEMVVEEQPIGGRLDPLSTPPQNNGTLLVLC
jgi:hypothetical protein